MKSDKTEDDDQIIEEIDEEIASKIKEEENNILTYILRKFNLVLRVKL